jgi:hypothetical protein
VVAATVSSRGTEGASPMSGAKKFVYRRRGKKGAAASRALSQVTAGSQQSMSPMPPPPGIGGGVSFFGLSADCRDLWRNAPA